MSGRFPSDDDLEQGLRHLRRDGSGTPGRWTPAGGWSIIGSIVLDSSERDLEAVRSTATTDHRQLVIEAGGAIVVLDVTPSPDGDERVLRGHVTAVDPTACAIQFVDPTGHELALVLADDLGEFDAVVLPGRMTMFVATDSFDAAVDIDIE